MFPTRPRPNGSPTEGEGQKLLAQGNALGINDIQTNAL